MTSASSRLGEKAGDTCSSHFPLKLCNWPGRLLNCSFCFKSSFGLQLMVDRSSLKLLAPIGHEAIRLFYSLSLWDTWKDEIALGFFIHAQLGQSLKS